MKCFPHLWCWDALLYLPVNVPFKMCHLVRYTIVQKWSETHKVQRKLYLVPIKPINLKSSKCIDTKWGFSSCYTSPLQIVNLTCCMHLDNSGQACQSIKITENLNSVPYHIGSKANFISSLNSINMSSFNLVFQKSISNRTVSKTINISCINEQSGSSL